jgi:hypothetical protein
MHIMRSPFRREKGRGLGRISAHKENFPQRAERRSLRCPPSSVEMVSASAPLCYPLHAELPIPT